MLSTEIHEYPGYKIPTRGFLQGKKWFRLNSTEFCDSNYDDIKGLFDMVVFLGCRIISNAISEYRMEKQDVVPGFPDRASYDKLSVVVIGLKVNLSGPFIGILNTLCRQKFQWHRKIIVKRKIFHENGSGLSGGWNLMCNLSGYVKKRHWKRHWKASKVVKEGENALGKLWIFYSVKGDVANAKLAATDEKSKRKELYRKYGIIEKPKPEI